MESNRQVKFHLHELALVLFFMKACTSDIFPKAQNVTWSSLNFKTILMWSPKPTNHSYTVEFSQYTTIGRPEFKIEVSSDKRKTTLHVADIPTSLFNEDKKRLNIQDVFGDTLQYKITYRKAKSTGKKEKISKSSIIELTDLDRGESYCFYVQAFLPFRAQDKQHREISNIQCSLEEIFEVAKELEIVHIYRKQLTCALTNKVDIEVQTRITKKKQYSLKNKQQFKSMI